MTSVLGQARVTAACNAMHVIEARFCRWLLQTADRAASDTVKPSVFITAISFGIYLAARVTGARRRPAYA